MMACSSDGGGDVVDLELRDPSQDEALVTQEEEAIFISTSDATDWNLALLLSSRLVRIHADRSILIHHSSYFRALLTGSFSESSLDYIPIRWNLASFLGILRFICGCSLNITADNFLLLLEGALFFGVESLFVECKTWLCKITSEISEDSSQMSLDTLLEIWNFGLEHGIGFIPDLCIVCLACNFVVESEKQLCEALIIWLSKNMKSPDCSSIDSGDGNVGILKRVRINLLPLGFAAGQRRCFSKFSCECVCAILDLLKDYSSWPINGTTEDEVNKFKIRLTKFSKKVVLSGCAHIPVAFLFLAVIPQNFDARTMTRIVNSLIQLDCNVGACHLKLGNAFDTLSFEAVYEVDISKCTKLHADATIKWLHLAFPSLKVLKASHCLQFGVEDLFYLIQKCPCIEEVDLSVDISPVTSTKVSILSSSSEVYPQGQSKARPSLNSISRCTSGKLLFSNITKLTLEGRNDVNDFDLVNISALANSLTYLNIKGCSLVTDMGISRLLCKCFSLHSIILSYTSFGGYATSTLCSDSLHGCHELQLEKHSYSMASRLQQLHLDGCNGVDQNSMLQLMSQVHMLKNLSLRETSLTDDALYNFKSSCLESFDISETMVSVQALIHVLKRNPGVRYLKANGCRNLHKPEGHGFSYTDGASFQNLFDDLGKGIIEEVAFGWGFSSGALESSEQSIMNLRAITVGLGASLTHHALYKLPKICPFLDTVILIFQVISDGTIRSIAESLKHLQVLELRCCLGDLTSLSLQISMPNLRRLRLQWVTPWMTNNDLVLLTNVCLNLVELSLSGCKLLNSDSQDIISSGWPGLTVIHLEDCGKVTAHGVSSLLDCKALEDLLLRHNGRGIPGHFVCDAALQLPLLRKVAVDICDACEGGFDSPSHAEKFSLSTVKISCCKSQRCGFEIREMEGFKAVHKQTVVMEWNHKELRTTVVKERI